MTSRSERERAVPTGRPPRSLQGRVVLVTRPREEAGRLVRLLEDRGAQPLLAPAIRIAPAPPAALDRALAEAAAGAFDWVVLTSKAGVEAVFDRAATGRDGPPGNQVLRASVAAVGSGTARALRERGVDPTLVPATFTTEALAEAIPPGTGRLLLARADIAPEGLEEALAAKGWQTVRVDAYRTRLATRLPEDVRRALAGGRVDALTFTSASTVEGFVRSRGPATSPSSGRRAPRRPGQRHRRPKVVCIGPVTAARAREAGLPVDMVARPHTIEGLVEAVERALGRHPPGDPAGPTGPSDGADPIEPSEPNEPEVGPR